MTRLMTFRCAAVLAASVLGSSVNLCAQQPKQQPSSRTIDPSKVIDGHNKAKSSSPPAGSATVSTNPGVRYTWEPVKGSDDLVLLQDGRRIGVYDPKSDTYRNYKPDGRLSDPVPPPWKQAGKQESKQDTATTSSTKASMPFEPKAASALPDLYPVYYWSAIGGSVPLVFIVIAFFFLMDDDENLGGVAWGRHKAKAQAMALFTQQCWKHKGLVAPLALGVLFFGIVGVGCTKRDLNRETTLMLAASLGVLLAGVLFAFSWQASQKAERTLPARLAVGQKAVVMDTIPAQGSGSGLVKIEFNNQAHEFKAVSTGVEILPDQDVIVEAVVAPNVLQVSPASFQAISWPRQR